SIKQALSLRMLECGLEIHPDKTKIVYCKDANRKQRHDCVRFDFLGYTFGPIKVGTANNKMFIGFNPYVSKSSIKSMKTKVRQWKLKSRVQIDLEDISKLCNPVIRGWYTYYGKYYPSALQPVWNQINMSLMKWAIHKYRKINTKTRGAERIQIIMKKNPQLWFHWRLKTGRSFV
ncbi:group II intron maturase-specific domain-containing protein, partial [Allofrancisella guangzhouensis]